MNFKGKRGTDKPIEIFIALFVILAVAMVILKMFSSQIEQKSKKWSSNSKKSGREWQKQTLIVTAIRYVPRPIEALKTRLPTAQAIIEVR
ncbi:MAG: hypothetical protein QXK37_06355 [Candidatus Woesearchaeota archaeon]